MKKTHIFVRLLLVSDHLPPKVIENVIGIPTADHWVKGEIRKPKRVPDIENRCVIHSGLDKECELDEHMEALLRIVKPVASKIESFSKSNFVQVSIAIYSEPDAFGPPLNFSRETMRQMTDLGASLDIDLYQWKLNDDEDIAS